MRIISGVINTSFPHRTKERSLQRTPVQIMAVAFAACALVFGPLAFAGGGKHTMYRPHLPRQSPTPRARTLTPHGMLTESRRNTLLGEVSRHDVLLAIQDRLTFPK